MGRSRSRSPSSRRRRDKDRSERRKKRRSREREKERAELSHRTRHHEPSREREFERSRSRDRSGRRSRSRSRSSSHHRSHRYGSPGRSGRGNRPQISEADLEGKTTEEIDMMKTMGFCTFDSTKNKKVDGNDVGDVHVILKRKYRQYMNRKGGFNRPLDFVA